MADEILEGRAPSMRERIFRGQMNAVAELVIGRRAQRDLTNAALDEFDRRVLGDRIENMTPELGESARKDLAVIYQAWRHEQEVQRLGPFGGIPIYRRIGLIRSGRLDEIAFETLKKRHGGQLPEWAETVAPDAFSEGWRAADNRIRRTLVANADKRGVGPIADMVESIYEGSRYTAGGQRTLSVMYHTLRFALDARWLALEFTEWATLGFGRGGVGAVRAGLRNRRTPVEQGKLPWFTDPERFRMLREDSAHWEATSDVAAGIRTKERVMLQIVAQEQPERLGVVMKEMAREDPLLIESLRRLGENDTPDMWIARLDRDWRIGAARQRKLGPGEAERMFKPWLDEGTISQAEYDGLVKAGRYTPIEGIEKALTESLGDPRLNRLLRRLDAENQLLWRDLFGIFFGQPDRSNLQRILNHPFLYWPISYQIKATKWLARIMFEGGFGVDTGMGVAVVLDQLHQQHADRMRSDPEYAATVADHPTLMFIAQMLLPITPYDIGVGLSPWTRLLGGFLLGEEGDETETGRRPYSRNIFTFGPGYTWFQLIPRLFREESQPGEGLLPPGFREWAQRSFPFTIPLEPVGLEEGIGQGQPPLPSLRPPASQLQAENERARGPIVRRGAENQPGPPRFPEQDEGPAPEGT
jgi:hypothetical protein